MLWYVINEAIKLTSVASLVIIVEVLVVDYTQLCNLMAPRLRGIHHLVS